MDNNHGYRCNLHAIYRRLRWSIMRIQLVISILFLIVLQLHADNSYAQHITIRAKNLDLTSVLKIFKQQSGYDLLYSAAEVSKEADPVNIELVNVPVQVALREIFKGQQKLEYALDQNAVIIRKKSGRVEKPAKTLSLIHI